MAVSAKKDSVLSKYISYDKINKEQYKISKIGKMNMPNSINKLQYLLDQLTTQDKPQLSGKDTEDHEMAVSKQQRNAMEALREMQNILKTRKEIKFNKNQKEQFIRAIIGFGSFGLADMAAEVMRGQYRDDDREIVNTDLLSLKFIETSKGNNIKLIEVDQINKRLSPEQEAFVHLLSLLFLGTKYEEQAKMFGKGDGALLFPGCLIVKYKAAPRKVAQFGNWLASIGGNIDRMCGIGTTIHRIYVPMINEYLESQGSSLRAGVNHKPKPNPRNLGLEASRETQGTQQKLSLNYPAVS